VEFEGLRAGPLYQSIGGYTVLEWQKGADSSSARLKTRETQAKALGCKSGEYLRQRRIRRKAEYNVEAANQQLDLI
jgi:hypothetical protein